MAAAQCTPAVFSRNRSRRLVRASRGHAQDPARTGAAARGTCANARLRCIFNRVIDRAVEKRKANRGQCSSRTGIAAKMVETGILARNDLSLAGPTANLEHLIRLADCRAKRKAIQCVIDEAESNDGRSCIRQPNPMCRSSVLKVRPIGLVGWWGDYRDRRPLLS